MRYARRLQGSGARPVLSLLIITVSFLPVFTLEAQEGACSRRWPTEDLLDGRRGAAVGDAGAGADDAVHPRAIMPEEEATR